MREPTKSNHDNLSKPNRHLEYSQIYTLQINHSKNKCRSTPWIIHCYHYYYIISSFLGRNHYSPMVFLICPKITRNWRFRVSYHGNPEMEVSGTSLKRPTINGYLMYPKVDIEDRKKLLDEKYLLRNWCFLLLIFQQC